MTVQELIDALERMPPDVEVYYDSGPYEGQVYAAECDPDPKLKDDGRVRL